MRVGLNALYLVPDDCGGLETFARELVFALASLNTGIEYVLFVSRDAERIFEPIKSKIKIIVCPFSARSRMLRYCWEQLLLPWQSMWQRVEVLHSLGYVGPILSPVPTLLTIHDANSQVVGASMSRVRRTVLWLVSRHASKTADMVNTISGFAQREINQWYGLPAARIRVILSGPGNEPGTSEDVLPPDLEKVASEGPFIAVIGGGYPHKNIPRLVEAFKRISGRIPHRLVVLGKVHGSPQPGDKVIYTGYLSRTDLQGMLRRCDLFVMPSLYEGFGFPVLEAQRLGAPVACSDAASLGELTGGSAALFNPEDVENMAAVIEHCVLNRETNAELRRSAVENSQRFAWAVTAQAYERAYKSIPRIAHWIEHSLQCIAKLA